MKKTLTALTLALLAGFSYAEWTISFTSGVFFENGTAEENMVSEAYGFALIVDMNNNGFSEFKLEAGDVLKTNSFLNASNDYKTLVSGNLEDRDGEGAFFAYSKNDWNFKNPDYGFKGNELVTLVVWNNTQTMGGDNSYSVQEADKYVVLMPGSMSESTGGNEWRITTADLGETLTWTSMSEITDEDVTFADAKFEINQTVAGEAVPEPSTYAAIFGALAFGFAAYRRRK